MGDSVRCIGGLLRGGSWRRILLERADAGLDGGGAGVVVQAAQNLGIAAEQRRQSRIIEAAVLFLLGQ